MVLRGLSIYLCSKSVSNLNSPAVKITTLATYLKFFQFVNFFSLFGYGVLGLQTFFRGFNSISVGLFSSSTKDESFGMVVGIFYFVVSAFAIGQLTHGKIIDKAVKDLSK